MKSAKQAGILLVSALVLIPLMVLVGNMNTKAENPDLARAEFFVS